MIGLLISDMRCSRILLRPVSLGFIFFFSVWRISVGIWLRTLLIPFTTFISPFTFFQFEPDTFITPKNGTRRTPGKAKTSDPNKAKHNLPRDLVLVSVASRSNSNAFASLRRFLTLPLLYTPLNRDHHGSRPHQAC